MHPPAIPSGWLLGAVAEFDALADLADRVIAQLMTVEGDRGDVALSDIVEIRNRMRELDVFDEASVAALRDELAARYAELRS